ncbi:hypothetical protein ACIP6Q_11435 [Streptomyces bobili]|uniref:hypothetical protein n=1 Tax=Streptomyces bobili TaxID=67280 RepID=UPI00382785DD
MDMSSREIRLPLDQAVAVLLDLNEFVVSLDRLGSRQADGTADEHTIGKFIADWDVARRLARARGVIGAAVDEELTGEEQWRSTSWGRRAASTRTMSATNPPTSRPEAHQDAGPHGHPHVHTYATVADGAATAVTAAG